MTGLLKPDECVFCEIIDSDPKEQILDVIRTPLGEIDVVIIEPYGPCVDGHLLFIPSVHAVNMREGEPLISAIVAYAMSEYSKRLDVGHRDYNMIANNGLNAGQSVYHMHFHYIPRIEGDGVKLPWTE